MSEFSESMASATTEGQRIFGDTCTIGSTDYTCIIHALVVSNEVVPGMPGRVARVTGVVTMTLVDWTAAGGAKGTQITVAGHVLRVMNDPVALYTADTVELQIGPLK